MGMFSEKIFHCLLFAGVVFGLLTGNVLSEGDASSASKKSKAEKNADMYKNALQEAQGSFKDILALMEKTKQLDPGDRDAFKDMMDTAHREIEIFHSKVSTLDVLKDEYLRRLRELQQLEKEMREMETQLSSASVECTKIGIELRGCRSDYDELMKEHDKSSTELTRVSKALKLSQTTLDELETSDPEHTASKKHENNDGNSADKSCVKHLADIKKENLMIKEERKTLLKNIDLEAKSQSALIDNLREQVDALQRSGSNSSEIIEGLQMNIRDAEAIARECKDHLAFKEERYADLKMQYDGVIKSTTHWNREYALCKQEAEQQQKELKQEMEKITTTRDIETKMLEKNIDDCQRLVRVSREHADKSSHDAADHARRLQTCRQNEDKALEGFASLTKTHTTLLEQYELCKEMSDLGVGGVVANSDDGDEDLESLRGEIKVLTTKLKFEQNRNAVEQFRSECDCRVLRKDLHELKMQNKNCSEKYEVCKSDMASREDRNVDPDSDEDLKYTLGREIRMLKAKLESEQNRIAVEQFRGECDCRGLRKELQELKKQNKTCTENLINTASVLDKVTHDFDQMKLAKIKAAFDDKCDCRLLEARISKLSKEYKECNADKTETEEQSGRNGDSTAEMQPTQDQMNNCQATLALVRTKYDTTKTELKNLTKQHGALTEELEDCDSSLDKCVKENAHLDMMKRGMEMVKNKVQELCDDEKNQLQEKLRLSESKSNYRIHFTATLIMFVSVFTANIVWNFRKKFGITQQNISPVENTVHKKRLSKKNK